MNNSDIYESENILLFCLPFNLQILLEVILNRILFVWFAMCIGIVAVLHSHILCAMCDKFHSVDTYTSFKRQETIPRFSKSARHYWVHKCMFFKFSYILQHIFLFISFQILSNNCLSCVFMTLFRFIKPHI